MIKGQSPFPFLKEYRITEKMDENTFRAYQLKKLKKLLWCAYVHIPYYHKKFKEAGFHPSQFNSFEDMEKIPVLTKKDIQEHYREMIDPKKPKKFYNIYRTGGSTGEPTRFYLNKLILARKSASMWRLRGWWGINPGDKYVAFRCPREPILPGIRDKLKINLQRLLDNLENVLECSVYEISDNNMHRYFKDIRKFKPVWMYGYTSAIYMFAKFILENHLPGKELGIKKIIVTADPVFPYHRSTIEEAFGARVIAEYGCAEAGIIAFECPRGGFHIVEDEIYLEIVKDGKPVKEGEWGEVLITTINSLYSPFIRYAVGDISAISSQRCECGRPFLLLRDVKGRVFEYVLTPTGEKVYGDFFVRILKHLPEVRNLRIIQKTLNKIIIELAPQPLSSEKERFVKLHIWKRFGKDVKIEFRYFPELKKTRSGKFMWVISELEK